MTRRLLIDTDPGIDDALALLYGWGSPDLRLAAITTVAGNVPVAEATRNLLRLVALCGIEPPPIAEGAAAPLDRGLVTATGYHGDDGLGDLPDWPSPPGTLVAQSAAEVIVEAARRAAEPLTLIALGPLTNVALALERDAAALDPSLVGWETTRLEIGPDGETRRAAGPVNCRFARTVDVPRFLGVFLDRVCPAS